MVHRILPAILLTSLTYLTASSGHAASLPPLEIQILGKALAFLDPPLTGQATVAIVYSAGNPASQRDAEALAAEIGNGLSIGGATLTPLVVSAAALAASRFSLVITALGAASAPVIEAARAQHALCVTADLAAVQAGTCTMAIHSDRRVEIFINRETANQAGLSFATAFRVMVHEL
jgi:hypothetical protein